jgi:hypothetical protein
LKRLPRRNGFGIGRLLEISTGLNVRLDVSPRHVRFEHVRRTTEQGPLSPAIDGCSETARRISSGVPKGMSDCVPNVPFSDSTVAEDVLDKRAGGKV